MSDPRADGPQQDAAAARLAQLRQRMVEQQLKARGIDDQRVLEAMATVPRHQFVSRAMWHEAYADWPLPIGYGQTISQPFTVAYAVQALQLTGEEKVLEVGTGSGYGAAVLSRLARQVHTIERIGALAAQARERLARLGYDNVQVHVGDGSLGLPEHAPFDAILVTACAKRLPQPYVEQLKPGGRIVIPLGGRSGGQRLVRVTRHEDRLEQKDLGAFAFVPLVGKHGFGELPHW